MRWSEWAEGALDWEEVDWGLAGDRVSAAALGLGVVSEVAGSGTGAEVWAQADLVAIQVAGSV